MACPACVRFRSCILVFIFLPLTPSSMPKPPITDAPWFWLLIFSMMALVALVAIGPKYGRRQEIVERRFEARRETARRVHETEAGGSTDLRPTATAQGEHHLLVPLWGLYASVGAVVFLSGWRLCRWRQAHSNVEPNSAS